MFARLLFDLLFLLLLNFVFFLFEVDVILLNMYDRLAEQRVCLADEGWSDLDKGLIREMNTRR